MRACLIPGKAEYVTLLTHLLLQTWILETDFFYAHLYTPGEGE